MTRRTKTNKNECKQLNRRIQMFIADLNISKIIDIIEQPIIFVLINFFTFLQNCIKFTDEFIHASRLKRFWKKKYYFQLFNQLNDELTDFTRNTILQDMFVNYNRQLPNINDSLLSIWEEESFEYVEQTENIFISGIWKYEIYCEATRYLHPFYLVLEFDKINRTLKGSGADAINIFEVNGSFNEDDQTIEMTFSYSNEWFYLIWNNDQKIFRNIIFADQSFMDQTDLSTKLFEMSFCKSFSSLA